MSADLEAARKALKHAAQVYAHTKKTSPNYEAAVKNHERAAILFVAAAAKEGLGL